MTTVGVISGRTRVHGSGFAAFAATRNDAALQTAGPLAICAAFPGSSVVEQAAVNRWVAGSNPARGARKNKALLCNFQEELSDKSA
jgi:hypothetical protein